MILKLISFLIFLFFGWCFTPAFMKETSGNCVSYTTLLYNESDRTIISKSRWDMMKGGRQLYQSSVIRYIPVNGDEKSFAIDRTLNVEVEFHRDSLTVDTVKAFRINGPETSDPEYGGYIDPISELGFTSRVYIFNINGQFILGFRGLPLSFCQK